MNNSNYNLRVASNDYVPGPKYTISENMYKKPLFYRYLLI